MYNDSKGAKFASSDEYKLKRVGLKKLLAENPWYNSYDEHNKVVSIKTNKDWLEKILGRKLGLDDNPQILSSLMNDLSEDNIDSLWEARINGDWWCPYYKIMEVES